MKFNNNQAQRQKGFSATMYVLLKLRKEGKISSADYNKAYRILKDNYLPVLDLVVDYQAK
jgi:ribosomal protein L19E